MGSEPSRHSSCACLWRPALPQSSLPSSSLASTLCSCGSYSRYFPLGLRSVSSLCNLRQPLFMELRCDRQLQWNPSLWSQLLPCLPKISRSPKVMGIVSMQALCCVTHDQRITFERVFANLQSGILYVTLCNSSHSILGFWAWSMLLYAHLHSFNMCPCAVETSLQQKPHQSPAGEVNDREMRISI